MSTLGVRFTLGYATMVISVYVAHILFGVPLRVTVAGLAVLTIAGFILALRRQKDWSDWPKWLSHPAFLLIILGGAAIVVNGDIGYLPFGHDEFTHWLATPRLIHMSGNWAAVVSSLSLPFYTPGWQLTLLLPWQMSGKEDLGLSAAAPFVLHVTVISLMYDFVIFQLRRRIDMSHIMAILTAWAFVLLFLAAEGMGRLWAYTLLIEQPQIYSYTTVLFLIYITETTGQDRKPLYAVAGTVLASAYLYKVAALIFIPAVIGLSCILYFGHTKNRSDRIKDSLLTTALLAGPILIAALTWSMAVDANNCSPFSLSPAQMDQALSLDWEGLASRLSLAIGSYVIGYKLVLTLAASLGVVAAVFRGNYRATMVLVLLSATYFLLLYLYHLACFGAYYFENLASIPRFTRVPLQMFHALGLVMLVDVVLDYVAGTKGIIRDKINRLWCHRWMAAGLVILIVILGAWQGRQVNRSVVDMTTRAYQNIDMRIVEMRTAAKRIESLRGTTLSKKPVLMIISQGRDNAVISYAHFFAISYSEGRVDPHFTVSGVVSWSPEPSNVWQSKASIEDVTRQLSKADIIWPINLDPWIMKAIGRLVTDINCLNALPNKALVRDTGDRNVIRFRCIQK